VVIVTCTWELAPRWAGTVAVHDVELEHDVGAMTPPNEATIWPLALKKSVPLISTLWPGEPVDGVSEEIVGGLLPEAGAVVPGDDVVEVVVERALGAGTRDLVRLTATVTAASTTTTTAKVQSPATHNRCRRLAARRRCAVLVGFGASKTSIQGSCRTKVAFSLASARRSRRRSTDEPVGPAPLGRQSRRHGAAAAGQ